MIESLIRFLVFAGGVGMSLQNLTMRKFFADLHLIHWLLVVIMIPLVGVAEGLKAAEHLVL